MRAALLAVVIAVHGLFAAPVPHVVTASDLKNPVSRDELADWASFLTDLGFAIEPLELGVRVISVTETIGGTHRAMKEPFRPLMSFTGTGQGWPLFANPDTHPDRLEVEVLRRDGVREVVYRQLDPSHRWHRSQIAYRRMRGLWDAGGYSRRPHGVYRRFARWVARELFEEDDDIDEVTVRMWRTHTPMPGHTEPLPEPKERHAITVRRDNP